MLEVSVSSLKSITNQHLIVGYLVSVDISQMNQEWV